MVNTLRETNNGGGTVLADVDYTTRKVVPTASVAVGGGWQYLTAAAFVSMIIPIIVFLSLQRYFVRGITGGAVKG